MDNSRVNLIGALVPKAVRIVSQGFYIRIYESIAEQLNGNMTAVYLTGIGEPIAAGSRSRQNTGNANF